MQSSIVEVGMVLHLIGADRQNVQIQSLLQALLCEVRDAEVADTPVVEQLAEGGKRLSEGNVGVRPVDQVEVFVVGLQLLKRLCTSRENSVAAELLVSDLRRDKEFLAGQPAILDGRGDGVVVAVAGGGIEV